MNNKNKIRAEVERLLNKEWKWQTSTEAKYKCEAYKELLEYIDSIPEEPVSEDLEKELNNWRHKHFDGKRDFDASGEYLERVGQLELARHMANWQKKQMMKRLTHMPLDNAIAYSVWHSMSEDAENGRNIIIIDPKNFYGAVLRKGGSQLRNHNKERYVKWAYIDDVVNLSNVERIVKDWKEPVSEDLEEEFVSYIKEKFGVGQEGDTLKTDGLNISPYDLLDIANHFANWQKEQMMKGAAKGTVHHFNGDKTATVHYIDPTGVPMCYFTSPEDLKTGDKVKVIVVKEG